MMEQLSGMDSAFVYMESARSPMHIGGIAFFQPGDKAFGFEQFKNLVASRLDRSPVFRQCLARVPLELGRPFWIDDPHFDLSLHLHHTALPYPGGHEQLRALAEYIFSQPLPLERPPWSMTFVEGLKDIEGLEPGAFAIVYKVHHAAVDGKNSVDVFTSLLDPDPVDPPEAGSQPWQPEPAPGKTALLWRSYRDNLLKPGKTLSSLVDLAKGTAGFGRTWSKLELLPHVPFSAPSTPFNRRISPRRAYDAVLFDLDAIKAIKNAVADTTVNDVVLAICAGGLRAYLQEKGELPDKPLVAMVPISVRGAVADGGNQVSAMLVSLDTTEADPAKRLAAIHADAVNSKAYSSALGARTMTDALQVVPFSLATVASRLYTRLGLANHHRPLFNLVITNVPGPREPLYMGNAKMMATTGTAPVIDGLGLLIVITSYHQRLSISMTACGKLIPDITTLSDHIRRSFEALQHQVKTSTKPAGKPRSRRRASR